MTCSCSSSERGVSEAASLAFRIATVGLSLASAITTATARQCLYDATGLPAGTVSSGDYPSLRYAAAADLASAVLQSVAIFLEALGKKKAGKAVALVDKVVVALTSTSAALLLAVDEITSCPGRRRRVCDKFCSRVRVASALSLIGTVSVSFSVYTRRAPEAVTVVRDKLWRHRSPAGGAGSTGGDYPPPNEPDDSSTGCDDDDNKPQLTKPALFVPLPEQGAGQAPPVRCALRHCELERPGRCQRKAAVGLVAGADADCVHGGGKPGLVLAEHLDLLPGRDHVLYHKNRWIAEATGDGNPPPQEPDGNSGGCDCDDNDMPPPTDLAPPWTVMPVPEGDDSVRLPHDPEAELWERCVMQ